MSSKITALEPLINAAVGSNKLGEALNALPIDQAQLLMIDCGFFDSSNESIDAPDIQQISERNADALRCLYRGV